MTGEEVQVLQEELESIKAELEVVKAEKETLTSALEAKVATVTMLEQTVGEKDGEIATLKQASAEAEELLTTVNNNLSQAVSAYNSVVAQANPSVPGELIAGDTIEAIDQSLVSAKTLVAQVRQSVEADIAAGKVPAGAPARTPPDLSALSPREKIQYAITKEGGK